jgi:hypothetical protein
LLWTITCLLAAFGGSYLLLRPTLSSAPSPPPPWGLWLSTNTESSQTHPNHEPDWLLSLTIEAPKECRKPATVVGALQWRFKEVNLNYDVKPPTRLMLAVAGVPLRDVEMSSPEPAGARDTRTWNTVNIDRSEDAYVAQSAISNWATPGRAAEFRFKLLAAHPAGYGACYVTSPTLLDARHEGLIEGEQEEWRGVGEGMSFYAEQHHFSENLGDALQLDAVTRMSVPNQEPDRAALDAGARVQRRSVILTCKTHEPPLSEATNDRFYDYTRHVGERFCASIQTFRAHDASAKLELRKTLATILISVAVSMLGLVMTHRWRSGT